ncbi:MAG: DNA gyrase inhibitor YacG [Rhabdaerophilum sp.]
MVDSSKPSAPVIRLARCPICSRPAEVGFRPFCSKRCSDVDLNRWLGGRYAIPAAEEPDPESEAVPDLRAPE